MSTVTDLERKVQSLQGQLQQAQQSLDAARLQESGLLPGETVLVCKGKEYLFSGVRSWTISRKPWVCGRPMKKDRTWGEREINLYDDWILYTDWLQRGALSK